MKSVIETILALAFWIIIMLIGGVMESDLSFGDTILWIGGLFAALLADIAGLNALIEKKEATTKDIVKQAEYGNE